MKKCVQITLILMMISILTGCRVFGGSESLSSTSGVEEQQSLPTSGVETQPEPQSSAPDLWGGDSAPDLWGGNRPTDSTDGASSPDSTLRSDPLWYDAESLTAMIISDLHYTEYKEVDPLLVPGIAKAPEITDAIVAEVIDRHPDVLIMTGDNTNSGYERDVAGLLPKLQKIKDSGIKIIITTGNHDLDLMDAAAFESAYFSLLDPVDRDPASLSYTAIVKDVVFLAMDDNVMHSGAQGEFTSETMRWIKSMLSKYSAHPIIFLSHHNVLYGYGQEGGASHLIQNPELPQLLREGGVKLALTGHMHYQYVSQQAGLWEILSGMPFSGSHLIGNLAIGKDSAGKGRIIYYAEPIDFASYGSAVKEELDRLDKESAEYMDEVFTKILEQEGIRGSTQKKVLELIDRYFLYFYAGTLAEHAQEIREDPSYERMIKALWNYNYGPWMQATVETTWYSARELEISW